MYREQKSGSEPNIKQNSNSIVLIGDPHPAFSRALASIYSADGQNCTVLTTTSFQELTGWVEHYPGAVVLVNPRLKGAPGLSTVAALLETSEISNLVVLLEQDNPGLQDYFGAQGVDATVSKTADFSVIKSVLLGGPAEVQNRTDQDDETFGQEFYEGLANLTRRQVTILNYLKEGKLNKQIAHDLGISEATVKHHVSALLSTLGFYSRSQLVAMINELGLNVDYRGGSRKSGRDKPSAQRVADYKLASRATVGRPRVVPRSPLLAVS